MPLRVTPGRWCAAAIAAALLAAPTPASAKAFALYDMGRFLNEPYPLDTRPLTDVPGGVVLAPRIMPSRPAVPAVRTPPANPPMPVTAAPLPGHQPSPSLSRPPANAPLPAPRVLSSLPPASVPLSPAAGPTAPSTPSRVARPAPSPAVGSTVAPTPSRPPAAISEPRRSDLGSSIFGSVSRPVASAPPTASTDVAMVPTSGLDISATEAPPVPRPIDAEPFVGLPAVVPPVDGRSSSAASAVPSDAVAFESSVAETPPSAPAKAPPRSRQPYGVDQKPSPYPGRVRPGRRSGGWYLSGAAGGVLPMDSDNDGDSGLSFESGYDLGFLTTGGVGYAWRNGFRLEAETAYMMFSVDELEVDNAGGITGLSTGTQGADGDVMVIGLMANAAYDLDTGTAWTPFVLAGTGIAFVGLSDLSVGATEIADDSDWVVAFQAGLGVNYAINDTWSVEAGYRFFSTLDPSFDTPGGGDFDSEIATHNFLVGFRFAF